MKQRTNTKKYRREQAERILKLHCEYNCRQSLEHDNFDFHVLAGVRRAIQMWADYGEASVQKCRELGLPWAGMYCRVLVEFTK